MVELPSIKPRLPRQHRGLRKLTPDLISKARDETATQVTRVGPTFVGAAAFCLLSLLSPDTGSPARMRSRIIVRDRGGALRCIWLHAPPLCSASHLKPSQSGCLTQSVPYEGDRCSTNKDVSGP